MFLLHATYEPERRRVPDWQLGSGVNFPSASFADRGLSSKGIVEVGFEIMYTSKASLYVAFFWCDALIRPRSSTNTEGLASFCQAFLITTNSIVR